jgi:hypothetical protein
MALCYIFRRFGTFSCFGKLHQEESGNPAADNVANPLQENVKEVWHRSIWREEEKRIDESVKFNDGVHAV